MVKNKEWLAILQLHFSLNTTDFGFVSVMFGRSKWFKKR